MRHARVRARRLPRAAKCPLAAEPCGRGRDGARGNARGGSWPSSHLDGPPRQPTRRARAPGLARGRAPSRRRAPAAKGSGARSRREGCGDGCGALGLLPGAPSERSTISLRLRSRRRRPGGYMQLGGSCTLGGRWRPPAGSLGRGDRRHGSRRRLSGCLGARSRPARRPQRGRDGRRCIGRASGGCPSAKDPCQGAGRAACRACKRRPVVGQARRAAARHARDGCGGARHPRQHRQQCSGRRVRLHRLRLFG